MQYVANLRAARAKARALNRVLPELQKEFEAAFNAGTILELGPGHMKRLDEILSEELGE